MLRVAALLGALAVLLVLAPARAGAHAVLLTSEPAAGDVLQAEPTAVVLNFNEPVETAGGEIRVAAGDGSRVDQGDLESLGGGTSVRVGLESGLAEGSYSVAWRVTSADAHVIQGAYVFSIGRPGPTASNELPGSPSGSSWVAGVGRALGFAGTIGAIGLPLALLAVWLPLAAATRERIGDAVDAAGGELRRRATVLAVIALALLTAGAVLAVPVQAWQTRASLADTLDTRFGHVGIARLVLVAIVTPLLLLAVRRLTRGLLIAALACALPLALMPGLAGHASTAARAVPAVLLDAIHVAAAGAWAGGLALLGLALAPALKRLPEEARRPALLGAAQRFTRVAVIAVAVVAVSGTTATIRELDGFSDLVDTRFGRVLTLKVLVVLAALGVALLSRRVGPSFLRDVRGEAALLGIVIALTGALTGLAPGSAVAAAGGAAGPYSLQQPLGPHNLTFEVAPASASETNVIHLVLTNAVGQPAFDATEAKLTFGLPSAGVTGLEVPLTLLSTAHWTGSAVLPQAGIWTATIEVRRGRFDLDTTTAEVPISR